MADFVNIRLQIFILIQCDAAKVPAHVRTHRPHSHNCSINNEVGRLRDQIVNRIDIREADFDRIVIANERDLVVRPTASTSTIFIMSFE